MGDGKGRPQAGSCPAQGGLMPVKGGNAASVRLHEKFGFTYSGTLHEVGLKFGRYLDIVNYELHVG